MLFGKLRREIVREIFLFECEGGNIDFGFSGFRQIILCQRPHRDRNAGGHRRRDKSRPDVLDGLQARYFNFVKARSVREPFRCVGEGVKFSLNRPKRYSGVGFKIFGHYIILFIFVGSRNLPACCGQVGCAG